MSELDDLRKENAHLRQENAQLRAWQAEVEPRLSAVEQRLGIRAPEPPRKSDWQPINPLDRLSVPASVMGDMVKAVPDRMVRTSPCDTLPGGGPQGIVPRKSALSRRCAASINEAVPAKAMCETPRSL
jgi:hypothetical protein